MRYLKILLLVICVPMFFSASQNTYSAASSSYDIANIYEKVDLKDGSKSFDIYGNVKDAKAVFVPTKNAITCHLLTSRLANLNTNN